MFDYLYEEVITSTNVSDYLKCKGQREDHQAGKGLGRDPEIGVDPLDDPGLLLDVECRHIVGATRRHEGAGHRLLDAAEGHLHEGHRHPDIDLHGADPHHQGGTDLLYDAKIVPAGKQNYKNESLSRSLQILFLLHLFLVMNLERRESITIF